MARIAGIDLPKDKRIEIALTYIYGIGQKTATKILNETCVNILTITSLLRVTSEEMLRSISRD